MVKFRRSIKSDKSDSKPHHISIPPKDAIAIVPPKKVIKALYDYQAPDPDPNSSYLSFSTGDFLHVVGRENDTDWYEACNPLQGSRGLVPVKYFETVGKTVRDSGSSTTSVENTQHNAGHDSGYAEKTPVLPSTGTTESNPKGMRMSRTMGKGGGAMVYGIVMYDFKAERPDELEAKEGEAIIVIAQSNPEWFVAKPITRLGGPGLIPVSFIEIRDMATGQAVPDAAEAVQRAGVPRVEEWKKMAADYKNGSIPLGKLESGPSQLQQGMDRMSLGNRSQTEYDSGYASMTAGSHQRSNSAYQARSSVGRRSQQPQLLAPVRASVPRYCFADDIFWFIIEAQMEDGRHWELSRLYQDFYDLQINLIQEYPLEAGNVKGVERSLPYMPGPVTYVTDNISNGRRQNLDEYIRNLLKLGPHITGGFLVRKFFAPREGDYEIDPEVTDRYRLSAASQHSSGKHSSTGPSNGASRQSSQGNLHGHGVAYPPPNAYGQPVAGHHQRAQPSLNNVPHQQQPPQPSMLRENSAVTQTSTASSTAALKIKVWFEEDSCVVIRMPASMRFAELYRKLQERRALEVGGEVGEEDVELSVEYRDEGDGSMYPIEGDEDLRVAVERNPKLALRVGVVR